MIEMKAVYLEGPRRIVSKEVKRPTPSEDVVLVKIRAVGVCGSDIHYYQNGRISDFVRKRGSGV